MMNDPDTMFLVAAMEHERLVNKRIAEWHARQALVQQPANSGRASATASTLDLARRLAAGARRPIRRWLPLPWHEPVPRVSVAIASDV